MSRGKRGEGVQDLLDIARSHASPGQLFQQARHSRTQVHKNADEAARPSQSHGLFQRLQRGRLVLIGIMEQGLQGKNLDGKARVVGFCDERVQP